MSDLRKQPTFLSQPVHANTGLRWRVGYIQLRVSVLIFLFIHQNIMV